MPRRPSKRKTGAHVPHPNAARHPYVARYDAKLPDFFPVDPRSDWLFRLTLLRDDLSFEAANLGLASNADHRDSWRCSYFLRRMSISLLEASDIVEYNLSQALAAPGSPYSGDFARGLREAAAVVKQYRPALELVRHRIGGHLRPANRPKGVAAGPTFDAIVAQHHKWGGRVFLDMRTGRGTSLHRISSAAFLFAWPDVKSDEDYAAAHDKYQEAIFGTFRAIIPCVDTLLYTFWQEKRVRRVPPRKPRKPKGGT